MRKFKTKDWIITALLATIIFITQMILKFQPPISINGGLVSLGNAMLVVCAIVFGKEKGALAGAVGLAMFDVLSGYGVWVPFTFVIRGIMGYEIGYVSHLKENGNNWILDCIAVIISGFILVFGYFFSAVIIYGNTEIALVSIPGDIVNVIISVVIGVPLSIVLKKHPAIKNLSNQN